MTDSKKIFKYNKTIEFEGSIEKFIEYRLNYGLIEGKPFYGKITSTEHKVEERGVRKITKTILKEIDLPDVVKSLLSLKHFYIDENITINDEGFFCTMKSPKESSKILEFYEELSCIPSKEDENILILKLEVTGTHKTPFKEIIEKKYIEERLVKINNEIENSGFDEDDEGWGFGEDD